MKKLQILLGALIVLSFISCGDDEIADAEIRFRLQYNDAPLVMFENVNYPDGKRMYFSRVSFFIEDFTVKGEENTVLFERDYFDLADDHLSVGEAEQGTMIARATLAPGDYTASFTIGVDPAMNARVPAEFTSDNVLSNAAEYWPGWKSYVFAKVEGFIDVDGDDITETGFALHLGGDEALRTINVTDKMALDKNNKTMYVDIDLSRMFMNNGSMYDIASNPQIHSPEQNPLVQILADNLVTCF
jgi:hypothetical protein